MTPEEIETERYNLTEVIRVKKENIKYWKSDGCGLDKPTAELAIKNADRDLAAFQKRLYALPKEVAIEPVKEVAEIEEIEPAKTEEFEDPFKEEE